MPFVRPRTTTELLQQEAELHRNDSAVVHPGRYFQQRQLSSRELHNSGELSLDQHGLRLPLADIVMVFPYKVSAHVRWGDADFAEENRGLRPPTEGERHQMETWQAKRTATLRALNECGLVLMLFYSRDREKIYVRIAADDKHLRDVAELIRYKLELKPQYLSAFAEFKNDYPGRRELHYSDRCVVSHIYKNFPDTRRAKDTSDELYSLPGAIFRTVDRINLLDHIVTQSDHNCAGLDIGQLKHDHDVRDYFPLHEPSLLKDLDRDWFRAFVWGTSIDKVRSYFGERIAMYFLFMSHLNQWLIVIPSTIGILLWLVDTFVFKTPDNVTAMAICIGVGIWSATFIHFWRRKAARFALRWGTLGLGKQLEPSRLEFTGVNRINPVTGKVDRHYPWSKRIWHVMFSYSVLTVTIVSLVLLVLSLMWLRHVVAKTKGPMGRLLFEVAYAAAVLGSNKFFSVVATWLTDRENHRSDSEYAHHLLAKTVVFKFFNCYSSLYYVAFFKEQMGVFGVRMKCLNRDCLSDLGVQLAIFMLVRFVWQFVTEIGWPFLKGWVRRKVEDRTFNTSLFMGPVTIMPDMSSPEKQSLKEEYDDVYKDMDEVLILYGYAMFFVVACPWVPFVALISSILECILDQKKLVHLYRRPFPKPAASNEPWDSAFDTFGALALVTNTAVIVFSSRSFDEWSHAEKILLFAGIELFAVLLRLSLVVLLPAVPHEVWLLQMQQSAVVHRHLNLGGEEDDHETRASAMLTAPEPPPRIFDQDIEDEDYY